jgi:adenosylcobyric acid synthase
VLRNGTWTPSPDNPYAHAGPVSGYEVHAGHVQRRSALPLFVAEDGAPEGAVAEGGRVLGTLIHDVFWNPAFSRAFVNRLRANKGLPLLQAPLVDLRAARETSLDALADVIERECPRLLER